MDSDVRAEIAEAVSQAAFDYFTDKRQIRGEWTVMSERFRKESIAAYSEILDRSGIWDIIERKA